MSERYVRLFTLPENLYAEGSPIIIAAGTLLKDSLTNRIVAQLKMHSINPKVIKAVRVNLKLYDIAGNSLDDEVDFEYLDLAVSRDSFFGSKTPIPIPNLKARSYSISIQSAVFADNTVWNIEQNEWNQLPVPTPLNAKLTDYELLKQYKLEYGSQCNYVPMKALDLWYCACGFWNHHGEKCHRCSKTFKELDEIDLTQLSAEKEMRVSEEKRQSAIKKAVMDEKINRIAKVLMICVTCVCLLLLTINVIIPVLKYNSAITLMEEEEYEKAISKFESLNGYKNSAIYVQKAKEGLALQKQYSAADLLEQKGKIADAAIAFAKINNYKDSKQRSLSLWETIAERDTISAGYNYTVGIKTDGTVIATGENEYGQCNVSDWKDIIAVSAGNSHTVGLKSDGTVVAVGNNEYRQCDVDDWTDIVAISAGLQLTVGLKIDGTVVAVGYSDRGQCNVDNWNNIKDISTGGWYAVGLKTDGTAVATGFNNSCQCNVEKWKNIVDISAGSACTIGLREDGTIAVVGDNRGQGELDNWIDINIISSGSRHSVGLTNNGKVIAVGSNRRKECDVTHWSDIVNIEAGNEHTVGLKVDGTVIATGSNEDGQCNVKGWTNIKLPS